MTVHLSYIIPYNRRSETAAAIRNQFTGCRFLSRDNTRMTTTRQDLIVNWGAPTVAMAGSLRESIVLNPPNVIDSVTNKRAFFQTCNIGGNIPRTPRYTVDPAVAETWRQQGAIIVGRRLLRAHSGAGIEMFYPDNISIPEEFAGQRSVLELPRLPLYTQYIRKEAEYRIHFYRNPQTTSINMFRVQRKMFTNRTLAQLQQLPEEQRHFMGRIRNHQNGFIYGVEEVVAPPDVLTQATRAAVKSELHFGAVDVLWNAHSEAAYVLEVNTAPGLVGGSLDAYVNVFRTLERIYNEI